jgi:lipid A 3-O-deacylase
MRALRGITNRGSERLSGTDLARPLPHHTRPTRARRAREPVFLFAKRGARFRARISTLMNLTSWTAPLFALMTVFAAQSAEPPASGTLSVIAENDAFYDLDRHYTSGLQAVWVPEPEVPPPEWVTKLSGRMRSFSDGEIRHGYAVGQSMFTSSDIELRNPPRAERPYAGWLYGSIGLGAVQGRRYDEFGLNIGIIGRASLAEQVQQVIHEVTGARIPRGWGTQLEDEIGFVVTRQRTWRGTDVAPHARRQLDFSPHVGMAVGTVLTYGNAGVTMRYGTDLPNDYGPSRIQPGLPASGYFSQPTQFGWYLFAGIEARAVARNLFLDGNTFHDSRSVEKERLIGDLQFGVVFDWPEVRLSYTHVLRTREFANQDTDDQFGALSISVKLQRDGRQARRSSR